MANIVLPQSAVDVYSTPFKSYVALMSQEGTDAPTANVMNSADSNYLGDIVWTRDGVGNYKGTFVGAFTAGKTALFFPIVGPNNFVIFFRESADVLALQTVDATNAFIEDFILEDTTIEINVYP